ncbi:MAG: universal stress protein, partial [Archaeoglobaceae archaeon]
LPIIKRAEEIIEKLEKKHNVIGMSVVFGEYEKEIDRVLEAQKPDLVIAGRYMPLTEKLFASNTAILFYRGKIVLDRLLYVHSEGAKAEKAMGWLKKGKEVLLLGIVEPMLPPESHAKRMKEAQEKIKKELEEISTDLNANRVVLVGNIGEEVKRISSEFDADLIILGKSIGKDKVEEIIEKTEVTLLLL